MNKLPIFLVAATLLFVGATDEARAASVASVKSGNWSDAAVWNAGSVPVAGDAVTIAAGHTVTYNVLSDAVLGDVNINGTLKFSRIASTRLKTNGNIFVNTGGFLDMGTPSDQIPKNIKAEVIWKLTQAQAAAYVGGFNVEPTDKGLWVLSGGRWETHGAPLQRTWSKLAQNAPAGATSVIVDNDVSDWYIGGSVVITQTSVGVRGENQNEIRAVTALEKPSDGKTKITLDKPLTYLHEGTHPFKGEVGLLTRNILIKTELEGNEADYQRIDDVNPRKFAHTIHRKGALGNIQYTEFKYMGHARKLSRYPVHVHQMGNTSQGMVIRGNGLWYTGFRWINIHSSAGVLTEDNVGFSSGAGGYYEEEDVDDRSTTEVYQGISRDIVFVHNL